MTAFTVYATPRKNSSRVGPHFAKGSRLPYVELPCELRPGGMVSYGDAHGLRPLLARCQAERRPWVYLDNGYFRPGHFSGYYRATRDAYQHDGTGNHTPARWRALGMRIAPWRKSGSFVLVCPPSATYGKHRGVDMNWWLPKTIETLKGSTDREIRIRVKPSLPDRRRAPLVEALRGAHALVTHESNTAVEALLAGTPVFCTSPCAAYRMGEPDPARIETPRLPDDREQWAANLAANQWTIEEMRSGQCWRELMDHGHARAIAA